MKPIISPSILSADFGYLARDIEMIIPKILKIQFPVICDLYADDWERHSCAADLNIKIKCIPVYVLFRIPAVKILFPKCGNVRISRL